MWIAMRDQGNAKLESTGQIFFLEIIEAAQQAAAAVLTSKAHGTVDIAVEGAERLVFEPSLVVGIEHFCNHRRAVIEFAPDPAQAPGKVIVGGNDGDAEIRGDS